MSATSELRLSAQRALLGRVCPNMRLVKVQFVGDSIVITCIADQDSEDSVRELICEAASEIVSDFPDLDIEEVVFASGHALPTENILTNGWVYQRYESFPEKT